MSLRLLEAIVPKDGGPLAADILRQHAAHSVTQEALSEERVLLRALFDVERTEEVMDALEDRFTGHDAFRILLFALEATVPRPESGRVAAPPHVRWRWRKSREEVFNELEEGVQVTPVYLSTMLLSSVVAALGLVTDSVAVIVGAMVIAPLLSPYMALALGCVLGDARFIGRAGRAAGIGTAISLVLAILLGALFPVDPAVKEIASRTSVDLTDLVVALASGSAGVLAVSTGAPTALIGVMVAVALVPPLVACGLLLGAGQVALGLNAGLLFVANVVCVLFAGVVTFLAHGFRPRTWWEVGRARNFTTAAIVATSALLALIAAIIAFLL